MTSLYSGRAILIFALVLAGCASGGRRMRVGPSDSGVRPVDGGGARDGGGVDSGIHCGAGQIVCDGLCVSPGSDDAHCGACGVACAAGAVCSSGSCTTTCAETTCGTDCVDTQTDALHCGSCDVACATGEECVAGSCVAPCAAGEVRCLGACIDPATDAMHCGASGDCTGTAAGMTCATAERCVGGACVVPSTPRSCREALSTGLSTGSGTYTVDPDGAGAGASMTVYCDMTTDGGGWTLTYKIRNDVPSDTNPWWNMVMPGSGSAFPTGLGVPAGSTEGPTLAARASYTAATGATEWRATTYRAGAAVFDVKSSYVDANGQAMRCFAAGTCTTSSQTCSASITDGRVLANALGGPISAGGTGYLCDVGWTDCSYCVDWSSVRTDSSAGGSTTSAVRYVGDSSITITDTATFYWVR